MGTKIDLSPHAWSVTESPCLGLRHSQPPPKARDDEAVGGLVRDDRNPGAAEDELKARAPNLEEDRVMRPGAD
jgi:hypothetical protein